MASTFPRHPHHKLAFDFFAQVPTDIPIHLCRSSQQGWLRLITTPLLHRGYDSPPITNQQAWEILENSMLRKHFLLLEEPPRLAAIWKTISSLPSASPKVWMDAYLAAFAIGHGITLATFDRDFLPYEKHGLKLNLLA